MTELTQHYEKFLEIHFYTWSGFRLVVSGLVLLHIKNTLLLFTLLVAKSDIQF